MDVLLFGEYGTDHAVSYVRDKLLCEPKPCLLSCFLESVDVMLRDFIPSLPVTQRQKIEPFISLQHYIETFNHNDTCSPIVEGMLHCIAQLADYICILNHNHDLLSTHALVIGHSTGMIAAGAATMLPRGDAGIWIAVHAVKITILLALYGEGMAESLEYCSDRPQLHPSTIKITGVTEERANLMVDQFCEAGSINHERPYISAVYPSNIRISGRTSILTRFLRHHEISGIGQVSWTKPCLLYHPIYTLKADDIERIIDVSGLQALEGYVQRPVATILSVCHGFPYETTSLVNLYTQIVTDLLTSCQRVDSIVSYCKGMLKMGERHFHLHQLGPPISSCDLLAALQEQSADWTMASDWRNLNVVPRPCTRQRREKIAVVGMSARLPGAQDLEEFWHILHGGLDAHRKIPGGRFNWQKYYDPSGRGKNKSHTPFGCFVEDAGLFDPRFFNMSPREAMQTDPMQRLALLTTYEALEMSGFVANRTPATRLDRIGTFFGQTSDDWREINQAQDIDTYFISGGVRAFGPGRINYCFGFSGPSYSIDTACSSSMAAISLACNALWLGDCDTAVAGGMNIMTNPDIFAGLSKGQFLSKTGPCQTFDKDADGYCRGDGVATIILKRLSDAQADKDNILSLISAIGTNHSANAISITHPHGPTQEDLYRRVLSQASIDVSKVNYVEMHGTGTQAGDGTEMHSVANVFAPLQRPRTPSQKLHVGSVKANIGHGEAASGVTAVIKVLLMMQHDMIPPHIGIKKGINTTFPDLTSRNLHIPLEPISFPRPSSGKRVCFVNNFSAAGGNTAAVLEDGPIAQANGSDPRRSHVVCISARALASLKQNLSRLLGHLNKHLDVSLPSLSYTTTARREHYNYRFSVAVRDVSILKAEISRAVELNILPVPSMARVAFTFTGQGSLYPKVGFELFTTNSTYRQSLLEFDTIAKSLKFPSFLPLVDGTLEDFGNLGPVESQVGQVAMQMALVRLWESLGIIPDVVIGHSLGEYAALFSAGVLSAVDTLYLVGSRASILTESCTAGSHGMLVVRGKLSSLGNICDLDQLEVACINSDEELVLSGKSSVVDNVQADLQKHGVATSRLGTTYAFHSSQIDAILPRFRVIASSVSFREPKCDILSPVFGMPIQADMLNAEYLCRHARETVDFYGAIRAAAVAKIIDTTAVFLEIGPHPVTSTFVKTSIAVTTCCSLHRKETAWDSMATAVSVLYNKGAKIRWGEYHRDHEKALKLLNLPSYGWALTNYWIDYRGDWCLSKGDSAAGAELKPLVPSLQSTSVQRLIKQSFTKELSTVIAETDISRLDLKAVLHGHMVNGTPLCPSSFYGDIGYSIGTYMYKHIFPELENLNYHALDIRDMEVPKPLLGNGDSEKIITIVAEATNTRRSIQFSISSDEGTHAKFVVDIGDEIAWLQEWSRIAHLIQSRMQELRAREKSQIHLLQQPMAYKLFSSLVAYDNVFQGMKTVFLNPVLWEATADVVLESPHPDQYFNVPPYWIDSIGHISGFVMNVHDSLDSQKDVFISHGWRSLRIAKLLRPGNKYQTYVRMTEVDGTTTVCGDVYCLEGSTVIAVFSGVTFMRIPRKVLDKLLPKPGGGISQLSRSRGSEPTKHDVNTPTSARSTSASPAGEVLKTPDNTSITSQIMTIIAEECGVDESELADPNSFADLGVDSLMQLTICSRIREEIEIEIPSALFINYASVGALRQFLTESYCKINDALINSESTTSTSIGSDAFSSSHLERNSTSPTSSDSNNSSNGNISVKPLSLPPLLTHRKATSFLLQGNPKTAKHKLFLFPDGGGSAASYAQIPLLSPDIAVFGLNSPFMEIPHEYTCGVVGIARYYIREIKSRQPQGPYSVGGWSAGGVIAYEGARQLIAEGAQVDRLILIDSPCPLTIEPLPISLHQWFNGQGLLGDGDPAKTPPWLLPHFQASINALSTYNARILDSNQAPVTHIIWCEDGVCKSPTDPRPDPYPYGHAQFLLENKIDLGPQLWDALVGEDNLILWHIPGNHFTMMKQPFVQSLGRTIASAYFPDAMMDVETADLKDENSG